MFASNYGLVSHAPPQQQQPTPIFPSRGGATGLAFGGGGGGGGYAPQVPQPQPFGLNHYQNTAAYQPAINAPYQPQQQQQQQFGQDPYLGGVGGVGGASSSSSATSPTSPYYHNPPPQILLQQQIQHQQHLQQFQQSQLHLQQHYQSQLPPPPPPQQQQTNVIFDPRYASASAALQQQPFLPPQQPQQPPQPQQPIINVLAGQTRVTERVVHVDTSDEALHKVQSRPPGGIGMVISENNYEVVEIAKGSPAEEAGLTLGDLLISVDQNDIRGLSIETVRELIRGPADSTVRLRFLEVATGRTYVQPLVRRADPLYTASRSQSAALLGKKTVPTTTTTTNDGTSRVISSTVVPASSTSATAPSNTSNNVVRATLVNSGIRNNNNTTTTTTIGTASNATPTIPASSGSRIIKEEFIAWPSD